MEDHDDIPCTIHKLTEEEQRDQPEGLEKQEEESDIHLVNLSPGIGSAQKCSTPKNLAKHMAWTLESREQ